MACNSKENIVSATESNVGVVVTADLSDEGTVSVQYAEAGDRSPYHDIVRTDA